MCDLLEKIHEFRPLKDNQKIFWVVKKNRNYSKCDKCLKRINRAFINRWKNYAEPNYTKEKDKRLEHNSKKTKKFFLTLAGFNITEDEYNMY